MGDLTVLVVDDEAADTDGATKEIVIPATGLIDEYTGGETDSIKVTVSDSVKDYDPSMFETKE